MKKRGKKIKVKGRVEGCDKNPLICFSPPSNREAQAILIAAYSNHAMMQDLPQNVTPGGVQSIIDVLDIARGLANAGYFLDEYTQVWSKACEGVKSVVNRYKTTGKIGYDGWAIKPISAALLIHEQQLKVVSKKVLLDVIDNLLKNKA
jgi:hypothetical protein